MVLKYSKTFNFKWNIRKYPKILLYLLSIIRSFNIILLILLISQYYFCSSLNGMGKGQEEKFLVVREKIDEENCKQRLLNESGVTEIVKTERYRR